MIRYRYKKIVCILILLTTLLFIAHVQLIAHPHLFVSTQTEFVLNNGKIQGAYETWTFDRFFSADIIQGYDLNRDGLFDRAETKDVYDNAFINTKNYSYFTFIRQGDKRESPAQVSDFSVRQKNGIASYRFYVDLSKYNGNFYFAVYDYTFFCDFRYDEKMPVFFTGASGKTMPTYTIVENKKYPVYYDPFDTADMTMTYNSWKPGLQTYYPREIHITY
ncbi:DUF1007 family protein [Treponema medium]|uniref:DUF1007 family protein n=1 Tax=Treponema medium TaxID=58231 RepID=UPI001980C67E|nr:DUF1007 family protein [Treponema medium]QSH92264.1 DUF1007 family protein [Treponema medium]QSH92402.1 DUF1007 family protein [Treponema medium]